MKKILREPRPDAHLLKMLREDLERQILAYSAAALSRTGFTKSLPVPDVLNVYNRSPRRALSWTIGRSKTRLLAARPYFKYASKFDVVVEENRLKISFPQPEYSTEADRLKLATAIRKYCQRLNLGCANLGIQHLVSFSGEDSCETIISLLMEVSFVDFTAERSTEPKASLTPLLWNYPHKLQSILQTLLRKVDYDLEAYCCKDL